MGLSKIDDKVSQGIATITLNEPQRLNALSAEGLHHAVSLLCCVCKDANW